MHDTIADLKARGTLKDVTDEALGEKLTAGEPWTVYAGFDPTADSLHIGNLVSLMALRRFQLAGHRVIAVVGGATGMIGDPSGRSEERNLLDEATLAHNLAGIRADIGRVLDLTGDPASGVQAAMVVNNADWVKPMSVIDFLRDVGKHFRVNVMIQMTSVRDRLQRGADGDGGEAEGMSFTEFSYSLVQALDFLHLFQQFGCRLQIGGSDQWGNITSGIDLIHRREGEQTFGLTLELLLDASGQKFGKSTGGGSLWLSPARTSPYHLYQHFLNAADDGDDPAQQEVSRYLRIFTLLPVGEIDSLMADHNRAKHERLAQKRLAEEVVRMLHGETGLQLAEEATAAMFGGTPTGELDERLLDAVAVKVPQRELDGEGYSVLEAFVRAGLKSSNGEVRRLIKQNGASLNDAKVGSEKQRITAADLDARGVCLLRAGKKHRALLRFV